MRSSRPMNEIAIPAMSTTTRRSHASESSMPGSRCRKSTRAGTRPIQTISSGDADRSSSPSAGGTPNAARARQARSRFSGSESSQTSRSRGFAMRQAPPWRAEQLPRCLWPAFASRLHRCGLAARLASAAGFRNVIAHAYENVNLQRVYVAARNGPADLRAFLARVRSLVVAPRG